MSNLIGGCTWQGPLEREYEWGKSVCKVKRTRGGGVPSDSHSMELLPPLCLRSKGRELLTELKEDL